MAERTEATNCSGNGDCVADTMFHQGLCPKCKPAQATVQDRLRFDCARGCYCLKCEAAAALDAKAKEIAELESAYSELDKRANMLNDMRSKTVEEQQREIERLREHTDCIPCRNGSH